MANYPLAGDQAGFVYTPDLPMVAYNNAKAAGYFTAAAATSTTVTGVEIREGDIVILASKNLLATQVMFGDTGVESGIYVSATANGSFTVTHDAAAATAVFYYSVFRNF